MPVQRAMAEREWPPNYPEDLKAVEGRVSTRDARFVEPPADTAGWLAANAVNTSSNPADPLDDLEALRPSFERARIVGLGEATHGTREFFRLKHRLVRFLVTRMGFTAFSIEGFPAECMVVNDYVQGRRDEPVVDESLAYTLARMIYGGGFPWDTEEMVELIEWLREHNADPSTGRKVGFYGFDMHGTGSVPFLQSYIETYTTDLASRSRSVLLPFSTATRLARLQAGADHDAACAEVDDLIGLIDERTQELVEQSGEETFGLARRAAEAVRQVGRTPTPVDFLTRAKPRDYGQAQLARYLLEVEGPDGGLICWAHNGHVFRAEFFHGIPAAGVYLGEMLGEEYVVVGLAFDQGSFRAGDQLGSGIREFTVGPAPAGSLDATIATAPGEGEAVLVDLRTAEGPVAQWLNSPVPWRTIGGGYMEHPACPEWVERVPADAYDLVALVRETQAATALPPWPGSQRTDPGLPAVAAAAVNPKLEGATDTTAPDGWYFGGGGGVHRYELAPADEVGEGVTVTKPPMPYVGGQGTLLQLVDARGLQGQQVTVEYAIELEVNGLGNDSEIFVEARSGDVSQPRTLLTGRPIAETRAEQVDSGPATGRLSLVVPQGAVAVSFGTRLAGAGRLTIKRLEWL